MAALTVVLQHQLTGAASPAAADGHAFAWALALCALAFVPALYYPARRAR
ncbi:hypothetical protein P2L57_34565 [Streptomyces ferralitis]|uniref:MFS transporter n=1 Tax=Streptantibioticus ferralitis TaxID=236510 RepID=A0ABT5ZA90_9ACTN|nr:hypothetical protein [Streptantibioticus ferralitis]